MTWTLDSTAPQPSITQKGADPGRGQSSLDNSGSTSGSPAPDQATLLQLRARGLSGFFPCRPTSPVPSSPRCLYQTSSRHFSGSTVPLSARLCHGEPLPMETTPARPLALWFPAEVSPLEAAAGKKRMRVSVHHFRPAMCVTWTDHTLGRSGLSIQLLLSPERLRPCSAGTGDDDVSDAANPLNTALPFLLSQRSAAAAAAKSLQ